MAEALWQKCQDMLKPEASLEDILQTVTEYQTSEAMQPFYDFQAWPMPNSAEQVDKTVGTSQEIVEQHDDRSALISDELSQHVVAATGMLIFGEASEPTGPVLWLDHDLVAKRLIQEYSA